MAVGVAIGVAIAVVFAAVVEPVVVVVVVVVVVDVVVVNALLIVDDMGHALDVCSKMKISEHF